MSKRSRPYGLRTEYCLIADELAAAALVVFKRSPIAKQPMLLRVNMKNLSGSKTPKKIVPKKRRLVKPGSPSSDHQVSSTEEEDTDVEMESISDEEDMNASKNKKSSGKAKAVPYRGHNRQRQGQIQPY